MILLIVFTVPLFNGIFNIGNALGIFISIFSAFITIYADKAADIIKNMFRSIGGRVFVSAAFLILGAAAAYVSVLSGFMVSAQFKSEEGAKALIVLGCKVNGNEPSRMLTRRLDSAYNKLYIEPDMICVVSGGKGSDEDYTEASVMKSYLVKKGISEDRIFVEDRSENTDQNLRYSAEILKEKGIDKAAIVTDGFHQYRASLLAKRYGLECCAVNAQTDSLTKWLVPTYWVREWFAITKEYMT